VDTKLSDRSKGAKPPLTIRVLIADDSQSSRALLRAILEGSGYEVVEAENGVQVLERAGGFGPDLLILDLQMPKLDGYAAAKALRKIPAFETTPIIALTAALSDAEPEQIADAGFTGYLAKPIGPARLRQYITSLL
jgi:CheY-like chemotaxis protein